MQCARVLFVEDDPRLATVTTALLQNFGYQVEHAGSVRDGIQLARASRFDAAVLDINVDNHLVFPLARQLDKAGVPFVFTSGNPGIDMPLDLYGRAFLFKPYRPRDLLRTLATVLRDSRANGGTAALPDASAA